MAAEDRKVWVMVHDGVSSTPYRVLDPEEEVPVRTVVGDVINAMSDQHYGDMVE